MNLHYDFYKKIAEPLIEYKKLISKDGKICVANFKSKDGKTGLISSLDIEYLLAETFLNSSKTI